MTKLQIRMRQVDQVKDFVDLLSKYPYEMDLVSGRYTIDAKSLLGLRFLPYIRSPLYVPGDARTTPYGRRTHPLPPQMPERPTL